ncbi:N-acetyltransferase [Nocardioides marmoriginsengisoli]|uniref:N-acetyltransferase n=1 Tax=Nocardioides marmoriginsengisoli TaxID=661483 RepID=A0A3N0CQK4_9ACTN|nr:GNAT family protein [Nocardioides marmoriginsengisoli]RNL65738.1 N-acetyltransferase [Nocardioides marmoriginsengisoli]
MEIHLRPLEAGENPNSRTPHSEYDDFGPYEPSDPPPCRVDADGSVGIVVDDQVVGTVGWHWVQWGPSQGSHCPMLGISLVPEARGRGIGTRAQVLAVDLLFRHTTSNRIEAHTDVTNVAEQRALEKAGFTQEGVVRGSQWRNGAYHDGYLYSILRNEWEQS